jgi:hypothetical protein
MPSARLCVPGLLVIAFFILAGSPLPAAGRKIVLPRSEALLLPDISGDVLTAGKMQPVPLGQATDQAPPDNDADQTPADDDTDQERDTQDEDDDDDEWEA